MIAWIQVHVAINGQDEKKVFDLLHPRSKWGATFHEDGVYAYLDDVDEKVGETLSDLLADHGVSATVVTSFEEESDDDGETNMCGSPTCPGCMSYEGDDGEP